MAISDKLTYLNETKTLLKNKINLTGANITDDTFRQYPTKLQNALLNCWNNEGEPIFTNWGNKINGEGTNVKLDNTLNARMKITPKGNTSQTGTPTPSSPIPVNVVSGDNEVVVCRKNSLDSTNFIVGWVQNSINGTLMSNANFTCTNNLVMVKEDTTYCVSSPNTSITRIMITEYGVNGIFNTGKGRLEIQNGGNFHTANTTRYVRIAFNSTSELKVQLEKGSTATTYEPYKGQTYPLYLGVEQLFDKDNANLLNAFFSDVSILTSNANTKTLYIPCKPNTTYTISKVASARFRVMTTNTTPEIGITGSGYKAFDGGTKITLTTGANVNYLCVFYYNGSSDTKTEEEIRNSIQIVYGSNVNHVSTTPIELCKIGTYQDYIYKTDKWYLHKEIGKVVLNGSGNTELFGDGGSNINFWEYFRTGLIGGDGTSAGVFTNYFNQTDYSRVVIIGNGTLYLRFPKASGIDISTRTLMNNWLSTHNTIVYYVLNTPTEEEITNSSLINQLDALKGAMSYEGQTNISSDFMIVGASALGELE